jgi:hypothetical protein
VKLLPPGQPLVMFHPELPPVPPLVMFHPELPPAPVIPWPEPLPAQRPQMFQDPPAKRPHRVKAPWHHRLKRVPTTHLPRLKVPNNKKVLKPLGLQLVRLERPVPIPGPPVCPWDGKLRVVYWVSASYSDWPAAVAAVAVRRLLIHRNRSFRPDTTGRVLKLSLCSLLST